jgi:hypothetical protein
MYIKLSKVPVRLARATDRVNRSLGKARVELALIDIESRSHPHQRRRGKSADQGGERQTGKLAG